MIYSTFLGNAASGSAVAADGVGNAYVVGTVVGSIPTTPGAFQMANNGDSNAFVTKFNPSGSALVYSTALGGSGEDSGHGIALDSSGNVYVTGIVTSTDFPTTPGAFQTICNRGKNCSYGDAFVTKLNPGGSALFYSTYLGGNRQDRGYGIAVDGAGEAYVTGQTFSTDFPVTPDAFQKVCTSGCNKLGDPFVSKLNMSGLTTTTLSSSPNPSAYGERVTFTAIVISSAGAPPDGESVTFMTGKTVLGTGALSGGSASFATSTLKVGTISVKAEYSGDSNFAASTSKPIKQVVDKAEN